MTDPVTDYSRATIQAGSKSFAMAATLFDRRCRHDAYLLYAWCRHCDDEIDGQDLGHGGVRHITDHEERLERLRGETERALGGSPVEHPAFQGLARVVERHGIPASEPRDLLAGFAMDVEGARFPELDDVLSYCYHVAGVVGLMMARVMDATDPDTLDRACDLGIAFQLTNIARDVVADAEVGRLYLPLAWLEEAGVPAGEVAAPEGRERLVGLVERLLREADRYYASSLLGLADLTPRRAWAIATARRVYADIGRLLRQRSTAAWDRRASTGVGRKLVLVGRGAVDALLAPVRRPIDRRPQRTGLWTRPLSV